MARLQEAATTPTTEVSPPKGASARFFSSRIFSKKCSHLPLPAPSRPEPTAQGAPPWLIRRYRPARRTIGPPGTTSRPLCKSPRASPPGARQPQPLEVPTGPRRGKDDMCLFRCKKMFVPFPRSGTKLRCNGPLTGNATFNRLTQFAHPPHELPGRAPYCCRLPDGHRAGG